MQVRYPLILALTIAFSASTAGFASAQTAVNPCQTMSEAFSNLLTFSPVLAQQQQMVEQTVRVGGPGFIAFAAAMNSYVPEATYIVANEFLFDGAALSIVQKKTTRAKMLDNPASSETAQSAALTLLQQLPIQTLLNYTLGGLFIQNSYLLAQLSKDVKQAMPLFSKGITARAQILHSVCQAGTARRSTL